jgi:hypothetical protein
LATDLDRPKGQMRPGRPHHRRPIKKSGIGRAWAAGVTRKRGDGVMGAWESVLTPTSDRAVADLRRTFTPAGRAPTPA